MVAVGNGIGVSGTADGVGVLDGSTRALSGVDNVLDAGAVNRESGDGIIGTNVVSAGVGAQAANIIEK